MFGSSSPFGQSPSASFGAQSPFGQSNSTSNPFAPKPFGAANPFGAQTGSSMFGNTSTGVFGQSSSPLSSTPVFGAASSTGFGTSNPTFGSSSSSFGGSSVFGQKPAFGGFGSGSGGQPSPFGSSLQQSQPSFGSSIFGASSQPAFGGNTTPAFGATATSTFGASSTPTFGTTSSPAFGSTPTPAFGSTGTAFGVSSASAFGSGGAFGSSNNSVFGAASAPTFGTPTTQAFGAATTQPFGATGNPGFGAAASPAFGATTSTPFGAATSSSPSFNFSSSPTFGQTTSTFGSTGFGSTQSPFNASTSPFGASTSTNFGGGGFGQSNVGGSRVAPYTPTPEADAATAGSQAGKLESISAMAVYKDKCHEELRWEDYQRGDKGGPAPAGQSTQGLNFGMSTPTPAPAPAAVQSSPFATSTFGQSSSNPFSSSVQANPFASKPTGFGTTTTSAFGSSSPFGSNTTPNFGASSTPSMFGSSTPGFGSGTSSSLFSGMTSAVGTTSPFGSAPAQSSTAAFGSSFGNSQPSSLFPQSSSLGTGATFGQTSSSIGQTPNFSQNVFNASSGFGSSTLFSNSTGNQFGFSSTPSLSTPFQSSLPTQTTNTFNMNTFGQAPSGGSGGFNGSTLFAQGSGQPVGNQISAVAQPIAVTNPFGTLPAMPHMSIGNTGTSPSIQYGISSMPVVDKPTPVRISSFLTSRHLSQRRIRLPARKYNPKNDGSRVPFFSDDDETPSTPKADALFVPRENPRALIIRPIDQWPKSSMKEPCVLVHENGNTHKENEHPQNGSGDEGNGSIPNGDGSISEQSHPVKISQKPGASSDDTSNHKGDSYITLSGHRAGEAAIVYEHGADIEAMMPKLRHSDYYTEPRIQELAAKERAEPGFCRHVKDFVVGRHNYGSIRFLGETDVRRLDLETLIQFNNREVIVYMDDSKKPPVGQGLNKPAEVTLLNIKCYDKKTGNQILEGPRIEKYKEMLKKKAEDQGAEFLSFDPVKGEWKFRVNHFSKYVLHDDDQWDVV